MSNILKDPRLFVKDYLQTKSITVNERGELKLPTKSSKNNKDIFDSLYLDYVSMIGAHNTLEKDKAPKHRDTVQAIHENIMQKALDELITNKKAEYRTGIIMSLNHVPSDDSEIRKFVASIVGHVEEDVLAVVKHWMWQVKRKMNDESVVYHIMPIFYGKQGGGKSEAIKRLYAPLRNFTLGTSLSQMVDERHYKSMSENYIIFFDEMQGCAKTDIDSLKKQITTDYNDYRPMRTNDVYKVRQACSFIGATNRSVAEQIIDATGMRRFYEVQCQDKLDWTTLEGIDYTAMWQSIDESLAQGYILPRMESIAESQKDLVADDEIGMFMEARGIVSGKNPTKDVPSAEIYEVYRDWAIQNGFKVKPANIFGRQFKGKGISVEKKRSGNKTYTYYKINQDYVAPVVNSWNTELNEIIEARQVLKVAN